MIAAEELVGEIDLIDLVSILNDERVSPWIWQPFGYDEAERQRAIESARMMAECEYAAVESVTVPRGYLVKRSVDE